MKQKIGTVVIEADILRRAKRQAADQHRPLSELIQNALDCYLMAGMPASGRGEAAYSLFCEQPIRITSVQLHEVLSTDTRDS